MVAGLLAGAAAAQFWHSCRVALDGCAGQTHALRTGSCLWVAHPPLLLLLIPSRRPNAILEHRRPGWREPDAPAYLDVLWWDAHVVAVHKPSGLQASNTCTDAAPQTLAAGMHAQNLLPKR